MYGHVNQYLDAEAMRLRAERAEQLARGWRATAFFVLALLLAQTWLVVDTALELSAERQQHASTRSALEVSQATVADNWELCEARDREAYAIQQKYVDEYEAREAAEKERDRFQTLLDRTVPMWRTEQANFKACLSANHGLVEALREIDHVAKSQRALLAEQQVVIDESLSLARQCEAQKAGWHVVSPIVSEVRLDAR